MRFYRFGAYLISGFLALHGLAYGQEAAPTQQWLAEGDTHYQRFDNRLALEAYRKAYTVDSTSYEVLSRMARTLNEYGMDLEADERSAEATRTYDEAMDAASALERHHPDSADTYFLLAASRRNQAAMQGGTVRLRAGQQIEQYCRKGLAIDSTNASLQILYGVFIREAASRSWVERAVSAAFGAEIPEGDKVQALSYLTRAAALDPELNLAHYEMGITYLSMGRRDEAILHLQLAETLPARTSQDNRNRTLARRMLDNMRLR